jgi:hypothetical protein
MTLRQNPSLAFLCRKKNAWVKIALKYLDKLYFMELFIGFGQRDIS